jgi:bifunctional non-homologous end joining protein LigD
MAPAADEQLSLEIESAAQAHALPRLQPMRALEGTAPFDDDEWFFEPWWPGTPALAYLDDDGLRLQIEHLADPDACFPELRTVVGQFALGGLVVEASLLVLDEEGRPDTELLRHRLAEPGSRVGWPALVCSDVLYRAGDLLLNQPFAARRAELGRVLRDGDACVVSRGLRGEGKTLAQAVAQMGLTEISARRLTGRYRTGATAETWLRLPVTEEPAKTTRPLLALLQKLPL